jgi:hypothetical protein
MCKGIVYDGEDVIFEKPFDITVVSQLLVEPYF